MKNAAPRTRRQTKRDAPAVKAERARHLLDNAEVREVFKQARQELYDDLERVQLDGSAAKDQEALEVKRQLDALNRLQRIILRPVVAEQLAQQGRKRQSLN